MNGTESPEDSTALSIDPPGKVVIGLPGTPTGAGDQVQTFLPYPDYTMSAEVLDTQRLGQQRIDVLLILNSIHEIDGTPVQWRDHPATRMWRGHELQLCEYGFVIVEEWKNRGNADGVYPQLQEHLLWAEGGNMLKPDWFGDVEFHRSHQSFLLREDPTWYGRFFKHVPNDLPEIWPVSE